MHLARGLFLNIYSNTTPSIREAETNGKGRTVIYAQPESAAFW